MLGLWNMKVNELAVCALNNNTLALGSPANVRAAIDAGKIRRRANAELVALATRDPDAVIGFGGNVPQKLLASLNVGSDAMAESEDQVVVSGERNLLGVQDLHHDMRSLRDMFDVFEQKTQLMRLLEGSSRAEGVRIFIGGESRVVPFEALSVVSAPYEVDGQVVGTLGVIGPTRMPYDRMIQIVDITAKLVGNALSQR